MKDISFVFVNPKTGKTSGMTESRVNYLIKVSKNVTKGADSNYEKVRKIYEYIASNYYYDKLAFIKKKNQYVNPYYNIYNFRNNKTSGNSKDGKVATTCHGFSAMVVALARAIDMPARLVGGFHISNPNTIFQDKTDEDLLEDTHWWAEVYVDGRWVIIDANAGTPSTWTRSSFDDAGTWNSYGLTTYAGFDPSLEIFSNCYIYHFIYKGSSANSMICYSLEASQLRDFFKINSDGITNGKRINSNYTASKFATYGTLSSLLTDGYGRVYHINWTDMNLSGKLNVSNFKSLKSLYVSKNNITSINVENCTSLETLYAALNNIKKFDGSTAKKLSVINLNSNRLTNVIFKDGSKTVTVKTNGTVGAFRFVYDKSKSKRLTINAYNAPSGYEYLGIYNPDGKRISQNNSYSFNPSSGTYTVRYKKIS